MRRHLFFALFGLLAAFAATASGAPGAPSCDPGTTQSASNACAAERLAAADAELNDVYRRILADYRGDALFLEKLKAAQRLWIQLRDAEVEVRFPVARGERGNVAWGSSYPLRIADYRAELTRQRTRQLRVWLDGLPEGDLSAGSVHFKDAK